MSINRGLTGLDYLVERYAQLNDPKSSPDTWNKGSETKQAIGREVDLAHQYYQEVVKGLERLSAAQPQTPLKSLLPEAEQFAALQFSNMSAYHKNWITTGKANSPVWARYATILNNLQPTEKGMDPLKGVQGAPTALDHLRSLLKWAPINPIVQSTGLNEAPANKYEAGRSYQIGMRYADRVLTTINNLKKMPSNQAKTHTELKSLAENMVYNGLVNGAGWLGVDANDSRRMRNWIQSEDAGSRDVVDQYILAKVRELDTAQPAASAAPAQPTTATPATAPVPAAPVQPKPAAAAAAAAAAATATPVAQPQGPTLEALQTQIKGLYTQAKQETDPTKKQSLIQQIANIVTENAGNSNPGVPQWINAFGGKVWEIVVPKSSVPVTASSKFKIIK